MVCIPRPRCNEVGHGRVAPAGGPDGLEYVPAGQAGPDNRGGWLLGERDGFGPGVGIFPVVHGSIRGRLG